MTRRRALLTSTMFTLSTLMALAGEANAAADSPLQVVSLDPAKLSLGNSAMTSGADGAKHIVFAKSDWPNVHFDAGNAYPSADWREIGGIIFTLRNPDPKEGLDIYFRVDDSPLADGTNHCQSGIGTLAPGETATLIFAMGQSAPGMKAGPTLAVGNPDARQLIVYGPKLDASTIVAFQIFLAQPKRAREMDILDIHFAPKPDFDGIVDKFGQYSKADWPGKIHSDDDLHKAAVSEVAWMKANPPLPDRDEYGGWKGGPNLKATGFFRTALVGAGGMEADARPKFGEPLPHASRWWLVTPSGHLFWSVGADCIRPYAEAPVKGREAMFQSLSDDAKKTGQADFYLDNLQRKYGYTDWMRGWGETLTGRLHSMGFNTAGNWSDPTLFHVHPVPYTVPLYVSGLPPIGKNPVGGGYSLPDYFDERFPGIALYSFKDQTSAWKDDPWCLGYFVDNELPWDTWAQMGTGGEYVVARNAIAAPVTQPARIAFVKILMAKYATAADWAKAWAISAADWDAPVEISAKSLNTASKADCAAFSTVLAERYFSVVSDALKKAAPNQLYLGCRFAIRPTEMVDVAARYCDVVSFNIYEETVDPQKWGFTSQLGKPVIIGEFHFGATDRGMFAGGLRPHKNQAERAMAYETYVRSARAMPAFVGSHWFQWIDEPVTGRFDGENYNIGFVTVADTLYPELRDAARRAHGSLYG